MVKVNVLLLVAGLLCTSSQANVELAPEETGAAPDVIVVVREEELSQEKEDAVLPSEVGAPEAEAIPEVPGEEPAKEESNLPEKELDPETGTFPVFPEGDPSTEVATTAPEEELLPAIPGEQPIPEEIPPVFTTEASVPPTEVETGAPTNPAVIAPSELKPDAPPPKVIPICLPAADPNSTTNGTDEARATVILLEDKPGVQWGRLLRGSSSCLSDTRNVWVTGAQGESREKKLLDAAWSGEAV
ncbi:hypothetical protein GJAV_G00176350 [Gymnothorax javanicus]|nr:hypothetical protein GJAV_G00176350 [Gymnothorax javanicus]